MTETTSDTIARLKGEGKVLRAENKWLRWVLAKYLHTDMSKDD